MGRAAGSLIGKIVAVAWILLCVYVARTLPATTGQRIGAAGARALTSSFRVFGDAGAPRPAHDRNAGRPDPQHQTEPGR